MKLVFNKLVRDKIPDILSLNGDVPHFKILNDNDYINCLNKKLIEECNEVLSARNSDEKIEELADVLEVVKSLSESLGINMEKLEIVRNKKFSSRGGFCSKIFLESVEKKS